ncbi:hypothetical protein WN55_02019 [Dufourea novaeangliae]|uniref:Uncharacterized protein n=1 Tax=Dufourea novaeangliae TaxID=178035 RepID=A0A154NX08_DUFNO|nr:hypothetical protein WN55_02019 [Dufourea novaeangliae]
MIYAPRVTRVLFQVGGACRMWRSENLRTRQMRPSATYSNVDRSFLELRANRKKFHGWTGKKKEIKNYIEEFH